MTTSPLLKPIRISLSFIGLLVGAGFATGAEVVQYFSGFGVPGIAGAGLAGLVMTAAGAVMLQLGSVFLADEHKTVFRSVSHPWMARFLDVCVTVTLFCLGFVMLAGAGATLNQQLGWPVWLGGALMAVIVGVTGLLDVDKVSAIISAVTPLVILAVIVVFAVTMLNLPTDMAPVHEAVVTAQPPLGPWWLSALNYAGLALLMAVSMCLVIGGSLAHPREAFLGGALGGAVYTVLLAMLTAVMWLTSPVHAGADVPMLEVYSDIAPWAGWLMVFVIYAMIYNTAIGMFYALGRRLTASRPQKYAPVFLATVAVGYAISFLGFDTLLTTVFPILGWLGMVMTAFLLVWWVVHRQQIGAEVLRRLRIGALLQQREDPERRFTGGHEQALDEAQSDSEAPADQLEDALTSEMPAVGTQQRRSADRPD